MVMLTRLSENETAGQAIPLSDNVLSQLPGS
jgi:hypothetical protein